MRIAFLGTGAAAATHSGVLAAGHGGDVARYYASREPQRAAETCRRLGGAGAFPSYADAIGEPAIDAVAIVTPPSQHLPLTLAALEAGKHVIVEKPAFPRSADVAEVREAAQRAGRHVLVAENYPYKPLTRRLRALIEAGAVGDVRFVLVNAVKHQSAEGWRDASTGGGALLEGGIHWISLMTSLGIAVEGAGGFRDGLASGTDRSAVCVLRYHGGALGALAYSWDVGSPLHGARLSRIYGRTGTLAFESNGAFIAGSRRPWLIVPDPRDAAGRHAMWRNFLAVLRGQAAPYYALASAEQDLRIVEAARGGAA